MKTIISKIQQDSSKSGYKINLSISSESIPKLKIDQAAFTQVIMNLVDNAIKFSEKLKDIHIKLKKEEDVVHIAVQDCGIGIKKNDMKKIFERFYRGENEKIHNTKGSGLGLTLVKQIVEAHNGTIQVESEFGRGSVFTILFPIENME